jgi:hypothetical protein
MHQCPNKAENEKTCPCKSADCERHGVCCECVRNHKNNGGKPACMR